MSYEKSWTARKYSWANAYGTPKSRMQSYHYGLMFWNQPILAYLLALRRTRKIYLNITLWSLALPFREFQHVQHVFAVDETIFKHKYDGVLYVATCLDENEQLYPLTFGIIPNKNDASYLRLFLKFKKAYKDRVDLVLITDRHPSFVLKVNFFRCII